MKKNLRNSLILILIVAIALSLVFALASCKPSGDKEGENQDMLPETQYDKVAILKNIKDGLNAQVVDINNQTSGIREINQEFIFRASGVNLMIYYKAKIDVEKKEDSEILFKIDNLSEHTNALFIFYHNKDLYLYLGKNIYDLEDFNIDDKDYTQKIVIENFSTHRFFDTFMDLVESMDLKDFIYSDLVTSKIGAMYDSVETKNIVQTPLDTEGTVSTVIKDIDLDKYKQIVNGFVENNFIEIGTKIDVLTRAFFGFKFSNLNSFQVSRLTLKEIETIERAKPGRSDKFVDSISIIFSDKQSDNITDYEIGFKYNTKVIERNQFKYFTETEIGPLSPTKIDYQRGGVGKFHLIGNTVIPGTHSDIGEDWYTEIKGNLTANDNEEHSENKFMFTLRDKSVMQEGESAYNNVILEAWLKNGRLYIDATGLLEKYIGASIDYEVAGLPRAYLEDVNVSSFIAATYSKIFESGLQNLNMLSIFEQFTTEDEQIQSNYKDYLEFIESDGDTLILTINKKFVETVVGEGKTLASVIGENLNLEPELIRAIESVDIFDNLSAKFKYNFSKRKITLEMYNKAQLIATVFLDVQEITDEFKFVYPDENDPVYFETFNPLENPSVKNINLDINLNHQKAQGLDISRFVGLFAGDVSGKNTQLNLTANEGLSIRGDIWQDDQRTFVHLKVYKTKISPVGEELLFEIATNKNKTDEFLVYSKMHNLRYKISQTTFKELYNELVGSNQLFEYDEIVRLIVKANDYGQLILRGDDIFIDIKPKAGTENILKKYTGSDGLFAQIKLKGNFEVPAGFSTINPSDYSDVTLSFDQEVVYLENIYQLRFVDKVNVLVDGNNYLFNASYKESSISFVPGKDSYNPLVRLFGQEKSYNIRITDNINGHKKIQRLRSGFMEINPSMENPVPKKIDVIYQDGTSGKVDFRIIDFEYTNENIINAINGEPYKAYKIVVGEGSIYETKYNLEVRIISCAIKSIAGVYAYDIPVVASISIDPVEYALQIADHGKYHKTANPNGYNPIIYRSVATEEYGRNDLVIEFWEEIGNPSKGTRKEVVSDPNWDFDFDEINYEGFTKLVLGKYNTIDIAMELVVENKSVSHVKINDEPNAYYTVDALKKATHTIPSITSSQNEVRVYFASGHYRIIGEGEPIDDPYFDGYCNKPLVWTYPTANFAQVDGTRMPLNGGTQNKTTASFGFPTIGVQTLTLNVVCPTRVPKYVEDTSIAIVRIEYYPETNTINENATIREAIKTHMLSFYEDGDMGLPFEFDPYSSRDENLKLPSHIYMNAVYAGNITKRTKYNVTWKSIRSTDETIDNRNIIEASGKIKNALAVESYLEVNGVLGDHLKTNIRLLIHNKSAAYDRVIFYGDYDSENEEYEEYKYDNDDGQNKNPIEVINEFGKGSYSLEKLNAYNDLILPAYAKLIFPEGVALEDNIYAITWKTEAGLSLEEYISTVLTPEGGQVEFHGLIGGGDIVSQVIPVLLKFSDKQVVGDEIFGVVSTLTPTSNSFSGSGDRYEVINTYSTESAEILEQFLSGSNHQVGVRFEDGTVALDVGAVFYNLAELTTLLQSPYGSDSRFNEELYPNSTFTLQGKIKAGTTLEQEVSLRLRIDSQIIAGFNFSRIDSAYRLMEAGVSAIKVEQSHEIYTGGQLVGENTLTITINKPFLLKKRVGDSFQTVNLEEYLTYIFERLNISLGSRSIDAKAHVNFIENFNDIAYHKISAPGVNVTYEESNNVVAIKLGLDKFGEGSCKEPYSLVIKVRRDQARETSVTEQVEVFDKYGIPLYGSSYGYTIPQNYLINFTASGLVEFNDLVWLAKRNYPNANITKDAVVTNVINNFFTFNQNSPLELYAILPNGERFSRTLNFLGKSISNINYEIVDAGKFNITSTFNASDAGTLKIKDIYEFFPVEDIILQLPRYIRPLRTQADNQEKVSFEIATDWTPFAVFAQEFEKEPDVWEYVEVDGKYVFDINKIKAQFTSLGLARTPFARTKIVGYNGQEQEVHMYVQIESVGAGRVSHSEINFIDNHLRFDPYENPENTGEFILPKDILLTYKDSENKDVSHQFANTDNISYEIKNQITGEFEPIEKITYNRFGHTLDSKYGESTSTLTLRVVLPDDNRCTTITIECLNRVIQSVQVANKKTLQNEESNLIEATYYIDPYDKETFTLPEYAYFSFGEGEYIEENVEVKIELNKFSEDYPFTLNENGTYVYSPTTNSHQGGQYLFYGYLKGFGQGDARQYFFINVFILNRTLVEKPLELRSDYRLEEYNKNPIEFLARDIPYKLNEGDASFADISNVDFTLIDDMTSLETSLKDLPENAGATFIYQNIYANGIFNSYFTLSNPVIPEIKWFLTVGGTSREITNDDIVPTGFTFVLDGYIGYGSETNYVQSEKISLKLQARKWTFDRIQDVDIGESDPAIAFSPFTREPIDETFVVFFKYTNYNNIVQEASLTFVSETAYEKYLLAYEQYLEAYQQYLENGGVEPTPQMRPLACIYWGDVGSITEELQVKHRLTLRNPLKSDAGPNDIRTGERYTYSFQQVPINEISFGFGPDGGYGESGQAAYIVDPLNIVIPQTVLARGHSTGEGTPMVDIGEVGITWPQGFWNYSNISMTTATKEVEVTLKFSPESEGIPFTVKVHFINRAPNEIATNDKPNSYSTTSSSGGYANLMHRDANNNQVWSFRMNPVNPLLYVEAIDDPRINVKYWDEIFSSTVSGALKDSYYLLPSRLRIRYKEQTNSFVKTYGIPFYGNTIELIDVRWLISRDVPLEGASDTNYISASIRSFKVKYTQIINGVSDTIITDVLDLGNDKGTTPLLGHFYTLNLQVLDKSVEKTDISEKMLITQVGTGIVFSLQDAYESYALDPYNVDFPDTVKVDFEDGTNAIYTDLDWDYNEAYLNRADVISGQVPEGFMYLYASFKIYGARLHVRFKIRPRNIEVTYEVGDETSIRPLKGGIIYIVKENTPEDPENPGQTLPLPPSQARAILRSQLPTHLYYNFEIGGGVTEIAKVPLNFENNALNSIDITKVRDYGPILGNLGKVDKNNIEFIIRVFDPKLTSVNSIEATNSYVVSNYIYDEINVPVTRRGEYTPGAEIEKLPDKIMLTYDIYGGAYADIKSIQYIFPQGASPYALVKASYIFKLADTDSRLFGADSLLSDNKDRQMISMKVPVKTYVYNNAEAAEARFTQNYYEVELGSKIKASELPNVIVGVNRQIKPLWVINNINTNKAGTYKAYCYFKNAYGDIIEGSIDIIVKKYKLMYDSEDGGKKDFFIEGAFLDRSYSGEEVDIYPYIISEPLLREDGSFAPLTKYTIEYSIDNGASWQKGQPIDVNPAEYRYRVRISVTDDDDYNVTGSISFYLRIQPLNIYATDIKFVQNGIEVTGMVTYTYDGQEKYPQTTGVHKDVSFIREYRLIIPGEETVFSSSLSPINVGKYEMKLSFAPGQQNFIIEDAAAKLIQIQINKPEIEYSIAQNMVYTGSPADVPVIGLPQNLSGLNVTYIYYKEEGSQYRLQPSGTKIVDAGRYKVTVKIDGGNNYPSVNIEGSPQNNALKNAEFEILKKKIIVNINTVRSEYLAAIKPFDSALTIINADDTSEIISGAEAINILKQNLNHDAEDQNIRFRILSEAGNLTSRHLIGNYNLYFDTSIAFNLKNYEIQEINNGQYIIEAAQAIVIENSTQLAANINNLRNGDTVRWYLKSGDYGVITLNKNASVSIVGCYDPLEIEEKILVNFSKITVQKGSLNLNIVKFNGYEGHANLLVEGASSVTINNTYFSAIDDQPGQISPKIPNTKAIHVTSSFTNTLFINNTIFKNYEKAILINGGSIESTNSILTNNNIACEITTRNKYVYFESVTFNGNNTALNFTTEVANTSLQNNIFSGNKIAINRGQVVLRADTIYQNIFSSNEKNINP